ncbi:hypothetical protein KEM56_006171 [Ascosphaera pollenicola]|nr:hypothetical protein KEM56_006171 [Ascosphaera pollenicola]
MEKSSAVRPSAINGDKYYSQITVEEEEKKLDIDTGLAAALPVARRQQWPLIRRYAVAASPQPEHGLSPVLLKRARAIASEHSKLSTQLVDGFDTKVAKRVGELASPSHALAEWEKAIESISELQSLLKDESTDEELRSLAEEDLGEATRSLATLSDKLKQSLIPKHPFAQFPCLIEIRPGAGGDEAGIFAYELMRMYLQFCASHGLQATVVKQDVDEAAGSDEKLAEAVIETAAAGSYDLLRTEIGVHRVQRVPATETKGRTHTSAVSIMVLPSLPESNHSTDVDDPDSDYYINPQDVIAEKMKAGGAGGQHVNKTESAIRLTHTPTGLVVSMQDSRSQHENRRKAWLLLRARVAERKREAREEELVRLRRGAMGGVAKMGRENKIRTYNFNQNRCTDHRSGITLHNLDSVLDGGTGLEKIMTSVRGWLVDQEIDGLLAEEKAKELDQAANNK